MYADVHSCTVVYRVKGAVGAFFHVIVTQGRIATGGFGDLLHGTAWPRSKLESEGKNTVIPTISLDTAKQLAAKFGCFDDPSMLWSETKAFLDQMTGLTDEANGNTCRLTSLLLLPVDIARQLSQSVGLRTESTPTRQMRYRATSNSLNALLVKDLVSITRHSPGRRGLPETPLTQILPQALRDTVNLTPSASHRHRHYDCDGATN